MPLYKIRHMVGQVDEKTTISALKWFIHGVSLRIIRNMPVAISSNGARNATVVGYFLSTEKMLINDLQKGLYWHLIRRRIFLAQIYNVHFLLCLNT